MRDLLHTQTSPIGGSAVSLCLRTFYVYQSKFVTTSEMPEIVQLAGEFRELAEKLAKALEESIQDSENSFREIGQLDSASGMVSGTHEAKQSYVCEVKKRLESNKDFFNAGIEKFDALQTELIEVTRHLNYSDAS